MKYLSFLAWVLICLADPMGGAFEPAGTGFQTGGLFPLRPEIAATGTDEGQHNPWKPKLISIDGKRQVYKPAEWVDRFVAGGIPEDDEDLVIGPGFYAFDLEMYCLDVGSVSPPEGAIYMFAPPRGPHAQWMEKISLRLMDHPDIPQDDVQRLIWGIQCGVSFNDYSPEFRDSIRPLLTEQETLSLGVDRGALFERLLPQRFRDALDRLQELRSRVADIRESFESLERFALRSANEEGGEEEGDEKPKEPGPWAYIGNGLYARIYPYHYQLARFEIFKPAPYALERDDQGRVIRFESGAVRARIAYAPGLEPDSIFSPEGRDEIRIWRIESLTLNMQGQEGDFGLADAGWVLAEGRPEIDATGRDQDRTRTAAGGEREESEASGQNSEDLGLEWPEAEERRRQAESVRDLIMEIRGYAGEDNPDALRDMADLIEIKAVMKEAAVRSAWAASAAKTGAFMGGVAAAAAQRAGEAGGYAASVAAGDSPASGNVPESELQSLVRTILAKIPLEPKNIDYQPGQPISARRG